MKLKIVGTKDALHPSEKVVTITTVSGPEDLLVHVRSVEQGSLEIGYPVDVKPDSYLIELPRETVRGAWRVWVPTSYVY